MNTKSILDWAERIADQESAEKSDFAALLFALQDSWTYVHGHCTITRIRKRHQALLVKHGDFADFWREQKS